MLQTRHILKQMTPRPLFVIRRECLGGKICRVCMEGSAMHGQFAEDSEVVPFARTRSGAAPDAGAQLDQAGQAILQLVGRAAGIADGNRRQALEVAQKISDQLRAAEDRVAELETELTASQERADRAEQWLNRIYGEIEESFLQQGDSRRQASGSPQRSQNTRRAR
jgi:hypothetical protein